VTASSGGVLERLDDLRMCGECVAKAAVLIDPTPAATFREKADQEQRGLVTQLADATRAVKEAESGVRKLEKRIADLETKRDYLAGFRATVGAWATEFDKAFEAFREGRLRVWTFEKVSPVDPQAAEELVGDRDRLISVTKKLDALKKTGARLRDKCQTEGLAMEARMIQDRLRTMRESER
jgi:hypothetical protein